MSHYKQIVRLRWSYDTYLSYLESSDVLNNRIGVKHLRILTTLPNLQIHQACNTQIKNLSSKEKPPFWARNSQILLNQLTKRTSSYKPQFLTKQKRQPHRGNTNQIYQKPRSESRSTSLKKSPLLARNTRILLNELYQIDHRIQ